MNRLGRLNDFIKNWVEIVEYDISPQKSHNSVRPGTIRKVT